MSLAFLLLWATPLHEAAYRADVAKADALIRSGADVNAATDLGVTPLWLAAENGSAPLVKRLLDGGANPNAKLLKGETPLMAAARGGFTEAAALLLAKGADPNARSTRDQTALMWAASRKYPAVVKALLEHKADIHARSAEWKQMMAVPPHGYPANNKEIPHGGQTALVFSARSGDYESTRLLVEAGANVNDADAWGVSALVYAAHSGFTDLAAYLLAKGADPNRAGAGFTALHIAIMRRDTRLVQALLERGANPNEALRTWTPTRRSSTDYHFPPPLVGARPFWLAARFTQPEVMRLLLKYGADPKFVHTSRYVVEMKGYHERSDAIPALMAALGQGSGKAWVDAQAEDREALMAEAVKIILDAGASPEQVGQAAEIARGMKYPSVVRLLSPR
ncbi:MAG: hypothetical protein FJW39_14080 [Acidobacteria bacterium]|nr:hypothetical protein [Acidobacteriota bacterium]